MKFFLTLVLLGAFIHLNAQGLDTANIKKTHLQQLLTPAAFMIGGGISAINFNPSIDEAIFKKRNADYSSFKTNADDYLQFAPIVLTYGFDFIGMTPKTDFINRSVILFKSEVLMLGTVLTLKTVIHKLRPDASENNSFPSGHTASAFAAATFLSEEFGEKYKWVPYVSYSLASSVGVLRIMNNKHYLSDVLVGAGIGFLSTKVAYWSHQYKWGKMKNANGKMQNTKLE